MNESVLLPGPGGPVYYELAILPLVNEKTVMVFGRDVTLERNLRLALVGDAPYSADYIRRVRDTTDSRIVMPGATVAATASALRSAICLGTSSPTISDR